MENADAKLWKNNLQLCGKRSCKKHFEEEPLNPNSELTKLSNVVLTPHSASNTDEAYLSIMDCCVENVIAFFVRKELRNVLNPDFRG